MRIFRIGIAVILFTFALIIPFSNLSANVAKLTYRALVEDAMKMTMTMRGESGGFVDIVKPYLFDVIEASAAINLIAFEGSQNVFSQSFLLKESSIDYSIVEGSWESLTLGFPLARASFLGKFKPERFTAEDMMEDLMYGLRNILFGFEDHRGQMGMTSGFTDNLQKDAFLMFSKAIASMPRFIIEQRSLKPSDYDVEVVKAVCLTLKALTASTSKLHREIGFVGRIYDGPPTVKMFEDMKSDGVNAQIILERVLPGDADDYTQQSVQIMRDVMDKVASLIDPLSAQALSGYYKEQFDIIGYDLLAPLSVAVTNVVNSGKLSVNDLAEFKALVVSGLEDFVSYFEALQFLPRSYADSIKERPIQWLAENAKKHSEYLTGKKGRKF